MTRIIERYGIRFQVPDAIIGPAAVDAYIDAVYAGLNPGVVNQGRNRVNHVVGGGNRHTAPSAPLAPIPPHVADTMAAAEVAQQLAKGPPPGIAG